MHSEREQTERERERAREREDMSAKVQRQRECMSMCGVQASVAKVFFEKALGGSRLSNVQSVFASCSAGF